MAPGMIPSHSGLAGPTNCGRTETVKHILPTWPITQSQSHLLPGLTFQILQGLLSETAFNIYSCLSYSIDNFQLVVGLDNIYHTFKVQGNPFPEKLRGLWENQDTFVVEDTLPGQMAQAIYQIRFSGDAVHITRQEKYSGSTVELQGGLNPATEWNTSKYSQTTK